MSMIFNSRKKPSTSMPYPDTPKGRSWRWSIAVLGGLAVTASAALTTVSGTNAEAYPMSTNLREHAMGVNAADLAVGDFNNDGKQDIAVASEDSSITIMTASPTGGYSISTAATGGTTNVKILAADFDADGVTDLAVLNADSNNVTFMESLDTGTLIGSGPYKTVSTFKNFVKYLSDAQGSPAGTEPIDMVISENGNGGYVNYPDLTILNRQSKTVTVMHNYAHSPSNSSQIWTVHNETVHAGTGINFPVAVDSGNIGGSSDADIVVASSDGYTAQINVIEKNPTSSPTDYFAPVNTGLIAAGRLELEDLVVGDFGGDSKPDIAYLMGDQKELVLATNNGSGSYSTVSLGGFPSDFNMSQLEKADINQDGRLDLLVGGQNRVATFLRSGDGTFKLDKINWLVKPSTGDGFVAFSVAEATGDGIPDIIVGNMGNSQYVSIADGNSLGYLGSNAALNATISGSTACNANQSPAKAVDGSVADISNAKWCSTAATRYLEVDLGSAKSLHNIVLKHAGAGGENLAWNTRDFNIQVRSSSSDSWQTVATITGNTESHTVHQVLIHARYIRLNITTPTQNGNAAARIFEIEAWIPANLALGKSVTAANATNCTANSGPEKAVDGAVGNISTTKWCGIPTNPNSVVIEERPALTVNLGSLKSVHGFVIKHAQAGGESSTYNTQHYLIQYRDFSGTWQDYISGGASGPVTLEVFPTIEMDQIRLVVIMGDTGGTGVARIYEFEVLGS